MLAGVWTDSLILWLGPGDSSAASFHQRLKDLLSRCYVNEYAASVRVFARKA
jgi:hypothetical protein